MKIKYYILFLLLLAGSSCKQSIQNKSDVLPEFYSDTDSVTYYTTNNVVVDFDNLDKISWSDIFEDLELIPLATKDDCLISQIDKIVFHNDRYYVFDRKQYKVFIFDNSGRFLFKIDNRGQGPGEYPFLDDIQINPYTNHLELLCAMGFVYEYDLSGKHIKTIRVTDDYLRAVHGFVTINTNTILFFAAFHHPYRLVYYDIEKKKIVNETYEEDEALGSMLNNRSFYYYNKGWNFFRPFDRNVYKIGDDNIQITRIFDFGKYNRDLKSAGKFDATNDPYKNYEEITSAFPYWIADVCENNRYIIAYIKLNKVFYNIFYDKKSQQSYVLDEFTIRPSILTNSFAISHCNYDALKTVCPEKMVAKALKEKNSAAPQWDSNPVIVKLFFKKESDNSTLSGFPIPDEKKNRL